MVNTLNVTGGAGNVEYDQTGGQTLVVTASSTNDGTIGITNAGANLTAASVNASAGNRDVTLTTTGDVGVWGDSRAGDGVWGTTDATTDNSSGVFGWAHSSSGKTAGVWGYNDSTADGARGRRVAVQAAMAAAFVSYTGPGMGCQGYEPVNSCCFAVKHSLTWNGNAYRYFVTIEGSRATAQFSGASVGGWW